MRNNCRFHIILVILSLLILGCAKESPTRYALVYGISNYPMAGLNLPYSANDAISVQRLLERLNYTVILRVDADATLKNLNADFDYLSEVVSGNDLLLFFFSGHGISASTMLSLSDSLVSEQYFSVLLGNEVNSGSLKAYIDDNSLTADALTGLFATIERGAKVAIIDACYSGAAITHMPVTDFLPLNHDGRELAPPDVWEPIQSTTELYFQNLFESYPSLCYLLVCSSGAEEVAWDGFFSHSVFTYFFLMSAEQGDLNGDGYITALESYNYILSAYQKYWNTELRDEEWNYLPRISGTSVDLIVFDRAVEIDSYIINHQ